MKANRGHLRDVLLIEVLKILEKRMKAPIKDIFNDLKQVNPDIDRKLLKEVIREMVDEGLTANTENTQDTLTITGRGIEFLKKSTVFDRTDGFKETIQLEVFMSTFNLYKMKGTVPVHIAIIDKRLVDETLRLMVEVYDSNLVVSDLITLADEGERIGFTEIPHEKVGIAVLSNTVYDVIAKNIKIDIDTASAGLLHHFRLKPRGLVELISYVGTTISPSILFLRGRYTSVLDIIKKGSGYSIADVKEVSPHMINILERELYLADARGIRGAVAVITPKRERFGIYEGKRAKLIVVTGLNYFAPLFELGYNPEVRANETIFEFTRLKPIDEFI